MAQTRKLVAIMFTDIQGYTALMQQSESKAIQFRAKHRSVFNKLTAKYRGRIINYYGDGTLSIFDSAVDAATCGYELQLEFLKDPMIPVRIGIHMGDVVITQEDIVGNSVNIASRIESLAVPGSVLLSEKVKEEISNQDNLTTKDLGSYHLKNDHKPRQIYALKLKGLRIPEYGSLQGKLYNMPSDTVGDKSKPPMVWIDRIKGLNKSALAAFLLVFIAALSLWIYSKSNRESQAIEEVLPKLEVFYDNFDFLQAFKKGLPVKNKLIEDSRFQKIWDRVSQKVTITSQPEKVKVYRKIYDAPDEDWELLGTTPLKDFETYFGPSLWKFEKEGFESLVKLVDKWHQNSSTIILDTLGNIPEGMVRIEENNSAIGNLNIDVKGKVKINSFYIDRYETTNLQYQKFVDNGGYRDSSYWLNPFVLNGDTISFTKAMTLLVDKNGRAGPAGWELGEFPHGKENFPVSGISWYEAAAYAEFAQKKLPSVFHWDLVAGNWLANLIIPNSNIQGYELAPVGRFQGITSNGVYDMAGNVREWCWNASDRNKGRYILGGAWNDPTYTFNEGGTLNPFDRSLTNGFRCIKYLSQNDIQKNLLKDITALPNIYDLGELVSDEVFAHFKRQFNYDQLPLDAVEETVGVKDKDRTCEKIEFTAAYEKRMFAYLFLPVNASPPYQTVVFFPGTGATWAPTFNPDKDTELPIVDFVLKSGRAVLFPILIGTYDRSHEWEDDDLIQESVNYRNYVIRLVQDIRRSVDYLSTRDDIDTARLAYYGFSWGATKGALMLALEPRFETGILVAGGIARLKPIDEVAEVNYLPRVYQPVLMLNGRHDLCCFPVEDSQKPFFDLLGTPQKDKKHIIFEEAGHIPTRGSLGTETIAWLDKYLGTVAID